METLPEVIYPFYNRIDSTPSGYKQLITFYQLFQNNDAANINIDFSNLEWLDGNMCALFGAIIYKLRKDKGHHCITDIGLVKTKFDVLLRNGFVSMPDGKSVEDDKDSTVPLTAFESDEDERFLKYIEEDLLSHRALKTNKRIGQFTDHFLEVFSNIQLHARTQDPVFACGQYYPNKKEVKFTIVDLGAGYLPPIQEFTNGKIDTSEKAILWALDGNSTKKDAPGGIGLKAIFEFCKENKGQFNIITGGTYWGNNLGTLGTRSVQPFYGTIVHLVFNCN